MKTLIVKSLTYNFLRPTNALGCVNENLLHSNHRHVSATHVAILGVVKTRIKMKLQCVGTTAHFKKIIFVLKSSSYKILEVKTFVYRVQFCEMMYIASTCGEL
jgi:hypothetical protein